jgi:FkbM family methyltransferase
MRMPLRLIPRGMVVPIIQGPGRGLRWTVGSYNHGCWLGSYEYEKQVVLKALLRPGDVVYDVGAHVGYFTLIAAKLVGRAGHVYSFEPVFKSHAWTKRHVRLNNLTNVTAVRAAATGASCVTSVAVVNHTATARRVHSGGRTCSGVNLRDYIMEQALRSPTLFKIDIEGDEVEVVPTLLDYARAHRTSFLVSTHSDGITAFLCETFKLAGYHVEPRQWANQPVERRVENATLLLARV